MAHLTTQEALVLLPGSENNLTNAIHKRSKREKEAIKFMNAYLFSAVDDKATTTILERKNKIKSMSNLCSPNINLKDTTFNTNFFELI